MRLKVVFWPAKLAFMRRMDCVMSGKAEEYAFSQFKDLRNVHALLCAS